MTYKKQFVYALLTAILAGIITYVTQAMSGWPIPTCEGNGLTYICFVCWACYFVCGCNDAFMHYSKRRHRRGNAC